MFLHFKQKILQRVMRTDGSCLCDVWKKYACIKKKCSANQITCYKKEMNLDIQQQNKWRELWFFPHSLWFRTKQNLKHTNNFSWLLRKKMSKYSKYYFKKM